MKILVTNPPGKYVRGAGDRWPSSRSNEDVTPIRYSPFPFLLGYTCALLEKEGYQVDFKDAAEEDWERQLFIKHIESNPFDLIILQTSTPSYYYDINTLKLIKEQTSASIVAVGLHATAEPIKHLSDGFDYVIRGEYEFPALELARKIDNGEKNFQIKGIAYIDTVGQSQDMGYAEPVKDLNSLPWPARHLMPIDRYCEPFAKGKNIWMMATRGCAFSCLYCTLPVFSDKPSFRTRDPKDVCNEIEHIIKTYKPDEIYFDDASISINKKFILALCQEMIDQNIKISWSAMVDPTIDDEVIESMAKAGCRGIKIGIETGDLDVMDANDRKKSTLSNAIRAIKKFKELKIKALGTYMFGMPGETVEKAQKTIDFMLKLNIDTTQIFVCTPFPGTGLYKQAKEKEWLISDDWSLFDGTHILLEYPDYSREQIQIMYNLATKTWNRHILFKKPATVLHHICGIFKRQGLIPTLRLLLWGFKKVLLGK